MSGNKARTIKLFCPAVAKTVSMVAWEEQRVDLGSIAKTFGLDLQTIKLNGHFVSRGADLIASSVTWKSLLSFFSAKRLPTGENGTKPLVVDGKLCKIGAKRVGSGSELQEAVDDRGRPAFGDGDSVMKSKKMKTGNEKIGVCSSKRKQLLEDLNLPKKLKISETNPGTRKSTQLRCCFMKRMREDEGNCGCSLQED